MLISQNRSVILTLVLGLYITILTGIYNQEKSFNRVGIVLNHIAVTL